MGTHVRVSHLCTGRGLSASGLFARRRAARQCALRSHSTEADVVVCGGGVAGLCTAHALASMEGKGKRKVVIFESSSVARRLGGVTSWLSSGHVSVNLWSDIGLLRLSSDSKRMYADLARRHPDINYRKAGRLFLASNPHTADALRRLKSTADSHSEEATIYTPPQLQSLHMCPEARLDDVVLALYVQDEARLNVHALCGALAKENKEMGVEIVEGCPVESLVTDENDSVRGVQTEVGFCATPKVVDATAFLTRRIVLERTGRPVKLPLSPCQYTVLELHAMDERLRYGDSDLVLHDLDRQVYVFRTESGTIACGGFAPNVCLPLDRDNPDEAHWEGNWERFHPVLEHLVHRFPTLVKGTVRRLIPGSDAYTPDGAPLLGEHPSLKGYFVLGGMNGMGLSVAGGAALQTARIVSRTHMRNMAKLDVGRFLSFYSNESLLKKRGPEIASLSYKPLTPTYQYSSARNLRRSALHHSMAKRGAVFGEIMGYEKPMYFVPNAQDKLSNGTKDDDWLLYTGEDPLVGPPPYLDHVRHEYEACRERVGLIDMTNFSKFDVTSNDDSAIRFLQRVCSANVDVDVGHTIYTGFHFPHGGGYVTDCTVSRMAYNRYFVVAPGVQQVRVRRWLERQKNKHGLGSVCIQDVTSCYTALNLLGPNSRALLQSVTGESVDPGHFPSFRCKELDIGMVSDVRAMSISHCGELGWVLYIPSELSQHVYDLIVQEGEELSMQHCGYLTLKALRMEKFYVFWGMDIGTTTTPAECGRNFRVDYTKDFVGKAALLRQKADGVHRRYVQLLLERHNGHSDPWPMGREPVYRNGVCVGLTTSAAYGFTLRRQVCLGFIENREKSSRVTRPVTESFVLGSDAHYEVEVAGRRFPAKLNLRSPILPMVSSEHPHHYMAAR